MRMDLRHVRYFVAVAAARSFTRAAVQLRITQPALSRQIHDLEAELGVTLFERAGRELRLTSHGEALLRRGHDVLTATEDLMRHALELRGGRVGILRAAASPQTLQSVLAPFVARYLKSWPGIEIHLTEDDGLRLGGLVERGDVDVAIGVFRRSENLQAAVLFPVRIVAVVPLTNRRTRAATIDVTDLRKEGVLLLRQGFGTRAIFDRACHMARVQPRVIVEAGDAQSLIALAAAGRGIAVVASTSVFPRRKVHVVPILNAGVSLGTWAEIAWHSRRLMAAYTKRFIDELRDRTRRTYPGMGFEAYAPPIPRPTRAGW